jgi:hypothetical protein
MNDAKLIELAEDVAGLKVGMASIEDKLDALSKRLLGNGRKGLIDKMGDRVSSLERYRAWVIGSAAGVTGVLGVLAWIVMASK